MSIETTTAYLSVTARQALLDDWFRDYLPVLLADSSDEAIENMTEDSAKETLETGCIPSLREGRRNLVCTEGTAEELIN